MDVHENLFPVPLSPTRVVLGEYPNGVTAQTLADLLDEYPDAMVATDGRGKIEAYRHAETLCGCGEPAVFYVACDAGHGDANACLDHIGSVLLNNGLTSSGREHRRATVYWSVPWQSEPKLIIGPAMNQPLDRLGDLVVPSST